MITPCARLPALSSPALGAKLETLFACYREFPALCQFFESGTGAALAFFGGRLTVCGKIPADELAAFAGFLGARELEGEAAALPALPGFERRELFALACAQAEQPLPAPVPAEDFNEAYAILCAADARFQSDSGRLEWLSDLRRRANEGRAAVFCENGAAVVLTAKGCEEALLGAVACRLEARGNGSAARLVQKVSAQALRGGLRPVTVAEPGLVPYYERLGFRRVSALALLTRGGPA